MVRYQQLKTNRSKTLEIRRKTVWFGLCYKGCRSSGRISSSGSKVKVKGQGHQVNKHFKGQRYHTAEEWDLAARSNMNVQGTKTRVVFKAFFVFKGSGSLFFRL